MKKIPEPVLKDQLVTLVVAAAGMVLLVKLSLVRPGVWYCKVARVAAYLCAVVGAATLLAVVGRLFPKKS